MAEKSFTNKEYKSLSLAELKKIYTVKTRV